MALAHFRMLIHKLLKKDTDIVPEEYPLIILDRKSAVCMNKNGKDTKHKRHIFRIVHFVRNGENYKMHKIDCCEGGLLFADIANNNVGDNDLNTIMKYIMASIDNYDRTLSQEG